MKLQLYLQDTAENIANISQDAAMLRLFALGQVQWQEKSVDEALCHVFGVSKQQDWPWAALARLGLAVAEDGAATQGVDQSYWLFASPVNLALMRDSFLLNAPVPQPLSAAHELALRQSLNQHFAEENLEFYPAPNGHWWLRLPAVPALSTTSAYIAQGQNVAEFMPQGADALRWRARLNEVQMLLHGHAVNESREAQGELAINSIWLHGGGVLPGATQQSGASHHSAGADSHMQVYADDASVQGLVVHAGGKPLALTDLNKVLNQGEDALMFSSLQQWQAGSGELLMEALRSRKLHEVGLHFSWQGRLQTLIVRPRDLWKFWRKPQALEAYF